MTSSLLWLQLFFPYVTNWDITLSFPGAHFHCGLTGNRKTLKWQVTSRRKRRRKLERIFWGILKYSQKNFSFAILNFHQHDSIQGKTYFMFLLWWCNVSKGGQKWHWIDNDKFCFINTCGRQNNGPRQCPHLNPHNLWIHSQKEFADGMYLETEEHPGLPRWVQCPHRVLIHERGRQESQCQSDAAWERPHQPLLALKMEHGDHGQEMQAALEAGQGQGTDSLLELPEGRQPCRWLDFSPVRPLLDFWPTEL